MDDNDELYFESWLLNMDDCALFYFISWGVIVGAICCYGLVANALSLVAFGRDRRQPATTLVQCLAASDFMLLLTVFITDSVPYICNYTKTCANPWETWPYIRYIWILTPISHMCSVWFVVLISLNRFWAVCRATELGQAWSMRRAAYYVLFVVFAVVAFNTPRFFEYKIVYTQTANGTWMLVEERTDFGNSKSYKKVYKSWLVTLMQIFVPMLLLVVFTTRILMALRRSSSRIISRAETTNHNTSMRNRVRTHSEITKVLITVVIVTIICQTPLGVFHFVRYYSTNYCGDIVFYLENISKMLVNVNSSINFLVYCVASRKFRHLLKSVLACDADPDATDAGGGGLINSVYRMTTVKKSLKWKKTSRQRAAAEKFTYTADYDRTINQTVAVDANNHVDDNGVCVGGGGPGYTRTARGGANAVHFKLPGDDRQNVNALANGGEGKLNDSVVHGCDSASEYSGGGDNRGFDVVIGQDGYSSRSVQTDDISFSIAGHVPAHAQPTTTANQMAPPQSPTANEIVASSNRASACFDDGVLAGISFADESDEEEESGSRIGVQRRF